MNRRTFLESLIATGALALTPKPFIFDVGKNIWRREEPLIEAIPVFPEEFWETLAAIEGLSLRISATTQQIRGITLYP